MSSSNVVNLALHRHPSGGVLQALRGDAAGDRSLSNSTTALLDHVDYASQWAIRDAITDLSLSLTPAQKVGLAIVFDEVHEALGPV